MASKTFSVQAKSLPGNFSLNLLPLAKEILSHCLMPLLFVALLLSMVPIGLPFEFDTDEGINLMKALLYSKGFSLYTQIWSDQPPLLTVALHHWFVLFGQTILAGRLLVLLFSMLLVWSFYQVLRQLTGSIPAFIGSLLLIFSNKFLQLSASVMIGMPSLALAMTSIYAAVLYKQTKRRYFIPLSGLFLALSLQTKLFTILLIPLIAVYVIDFQVLRFRGVTFKSLLRSPRSLIRVPKAALRSQLAVVGAWLLSLGLIYVALGLIFHSINYEQLLQAHLGRTVAESFDKQSPLRSLNWLLRKDWDLVLLSGLGVVIVLIKRYWSGLFPLAWLAIALPLLLNHQPIWYHHFHLLSIPLAWLAAYAAMPIVDYVRHQQWRSRLGAGRWKQIALPVLGVLLLLYSGNSLEEKVRDIARNVQGLQPHYHNPEVVQLLSQAKASLDWIVTDRPIYAFQVGVPVPPELAVFSEKRFSSGSLTYDALLSAMVHYQPDRIIWSRFADKISANAELSDYITRYYVPTYRSESVQMYTLKT